MKNLKLSNLKSIEKNDELIQSEINPSMFVKNNSGTQSKNIKDIKDIDIKDIDIKDINKREQLTKYNVKNTQELFEEYMTKMNNKIRKV